MTRINLRSVLTIVGPFLGLIFIVALFAALLAAQDVNTAMHSKGLSGAKGFWETLHAPDFPGENGYRGFGAFLSGANFKIIFTQTVIVAIGALGMTLIIVSGGIDLSVGSVVALASVVGARLLATTPPSSTTIVVAATILSGAVVGLVNGSLIAGLRMMPFIVTLGMMGIARGGREVAGQQPNRELRRKGRGQSHHGRVASAGEILSASIRRVDRGGVRNGNDCRAEENRLRPLRFRHRFE
jgi:hypothetical protein